MNWCPREMRPCQMSYGDNNVSFTTIKFYSLFLFLSIAHAYCLMIESVNIRLAMFKYTATYFVIPQPKRSFSWSFYLFFSLLLLLLLHLSSSSSAYSVSSHLFFKLLPCNLFSMNSNWIKDDISKCTVQTTFLTKAH